MTSETTNWHWLCDRNFNEF